MNQLQLVEFEINEEKLDDISFYVLKLPQSIMNLFDRIKEECKGEDFKSLSNSVGFKIGALVFEEIIFANNTITDINKDEGRWIYSIAPFDLAIFKKLISDWLKKEELIKRLNYPIQLEEEWRFEKELISLKSIWTHTNENLKYNFIPAYYIYQLSKESFEFSCLNRTLKFHRVVKNNDNKDAVMITLPIELTKKKHSAFSYGLECRLIQPIDTLKYYLKFHLKCVRFYDETLLKNNYIDLGSDTRSVYVYQENKYFYKDDIAFHTLKINLYGAKSIKIENTGNRIFTELIDLNILDALKNPQKYRQENSSTLCLIGLNANESATTKTGIGLPERNEMFHLLKQKLPYFKPRELMSPVNEKKGKLKNDNSCYCIEKNAVKIAIASQDAELKKLVTTTLRDLLQIPIDKDTNHNGLKLEFVFIDNHFTVHLRDNQSYEEKLLEIENYFQEINLQCDGCLVDIENYHEINALKDKDTKHLVRVALKNRSILSQFINGYKNEAKDHHKVKSACKDLLFALGFYKNDLYTTQGLTSDDILIGLDSISTNDYKKRFAFSQMVKGKVYYKIYPATTWEESTQTIFSLNEAKVKETEVHIKYCKEHFYQWVLETLDEQLTHCKGNIYFYVNSRVKQRGLFPLLNNKNFINFNLELANLDKLKVIRINTDYNELPEYFIKTAKTEINKNKGIFRSSNQTYYLIGSKSDQDKVAKGNTKCSHPDKPLKHQSLLEINIQGPKSIEEIDRIAILTQSLRRSNLTYDIEASVPLPLYIIKRLTEYMKAIKKTYHIE